MQDNSKLFRKESLDHINSPEQLNEYIKVSKSGVWIALIGIICLLVGVCVWGIFGSLNTTIHATVEVKDGKAYAYIMDSSRDQIEIGMNVSVMDADAGITEIETKPVKASSLEDEYLLYVGNLETDDWVYRCELSELDGVEDGIYVAKIVVDSVTPMSFMINE